MFKDEYQAMTTGSLGKYNLFKNNPFGYFVSSMTAGAFIGVGVLLAFTVGGLLTGQPYAKIMMAATFSVALSLVIMAGAELFTGNNMVLAAGVLRRQISAADMIKIWCFCWIGNLVGSVLIACIYMATGLAVGDVGQCMADAAAAKMTAPALALFARGILCNFLVCINVCIRVLVALLFLFSKEL
jgi:nitrite transporter NirC